MKDGKLTYTSMTRGDFSMEFHNDEDYVLFNTDTTVENIVEYVAEKYKDELISAKVTSVYVSEGLSKGAMIKL